MNPIDKAREYDAILAHSGSVRQVAQATGVTEHTVHKYLSLLQLAPSIQDTVTTSEGSVGTGTLAKLAETFALEDQEEVLGQLGGLRQNIQLDILRKSDGDLEAIPELKSQAVERDLELRMCRDGLCFTAPTEWKAKIQKFLLEGNEKQSLILRLPINKESSPSLL